MAQQILNIGSMNIDHVYQVPHFVSPGETLTSCSYVRNAGGKGLNQSIALARAGVNVAYGGKIGPDGVFLKELLSSEGVDTSSVLIGDMPTGHAIIQVDSSGQNNIILYPGANRQLTRAELVGMLSSTPDGSWILLQNEINEIPFILEEAHAHGLHIAINPAPCGPEVLTYSLQLADVLFVNEIEGAQLANLPSTASAKEIASLLSGLFPSLEIILTLGSEGALYQYGNMQIFMQAEQVKPVDTTSAGDTFTGYFLAAKLRGKTPQEAMRIASHAAAITVTRKGAAASIPRGDEVFL